MKRLVAAIVLSAPLAAMGTNLGDQRLAVIDDPLSVEFLGAGRPTREKLRQIIAIVAPARNWKVLAEADGRFELTRTVNNRHVMRIELTYGLPGYAIRYLDSSTLMYQELKQDGGQIRAIHRSYNTWIRELATAINAGLGVSASFAAGPMPLQKVDAGPAAGKPASDRLPKVGTFWSYSFRDQHLKSREQVFTIHVTGVDGWDVHESFLGPARTAVPTMLNAKEVRFGARDGLSGYSVIELAPYLYSSELGKSALPSPASYPSTKSWTIGSPKIAEEEETQVPAGAFKTLRVEVTGISEAFGESTNDFSRPARFQYTAWYAPEVKRYVMTRHQTWSRTGAKVGDEIVKLVQFRAN